MRQNKIPDNRNPAFRKVRAALVRELRQHVEPAYRKGAMKYVKEGIVLYGVRLQTVRRIAAKYYKPMSKYGKEYVLALCDKLVRSKFAEEKTIAFDWAYRLRRGYTPGDFVLFECWLATYITNWDNCDDLCRHAFGAHLYQFPEFLPDVVEWTTAENRWLRRGAAVILIYSLRNGKHLNVALTIADRLLHDSDYLVQNGYGWMLKDASIEYPDAVRDYVMRKKSVMPRRALRYAIERFGTKFKKMAMSPTAQ